MGGSFLSFLFIFREKKTSSDKVTHYQFCQQRRKPLGENFQGKIRPREQLEGEQPSSEHVFIYPDFWRPSAKCVLHRFEFSSSPWGRSRKTHVAVRAFTARCRPMSSNGRQATEARTTSTKVEWISSVQDASGAARVRSRCRRVFCENFTPIHVSSASRIAFVRVLQ